MKDMSSAFLQVMYDNEHMLETHLVQLGRIEHANDEVTHHLFVELGKNFITPFDREDIHDLATSLDDVIDFMYSIGRKMETFCMGRPERSMQIVSEQAVNIVKMLSDAVKRLKRRTDLNSLVPACMEIKKLVYNCDNNIDTVVSTLFESEHNALELVKKMELYDSFQGLLEKCSNVINSIESVIIKYA